MDEWNTSFYSDEVRSDGEDHLFKDLVHECSLFNRLYHSNIGDPVSEYYKDIRDKCAKRFEEYFHESIYNYIGTKETGNGDKHKEDK